MANRIAEHESVRLPVMVCQDGFITSHAIENIELVEDDKVKAFVGEYKAPWGLLDANKPVSVGPLDLQAHHYEHKRQQAEAMKNAKKVIQDVAAEFEKMTGRKYDLIEKYMMDDAEIAIVVLNSTAGTAKFVVNQLREKGIKAGLVKPRVFRPFPVDEIADALKNCKAVAVMDKADSLNAASGPLFAEVTSAMFVKGVTAPKVINYIYGLGGRDVKADDIEVVYNRLSDIASTGNVGEVYNYLSVRE